MKGIKTVISGIFVFMILICPVKADTIQLNIQEKTQITYDSVVLNTIYNEIIPNSGYNYYEIVYNDVYNTLDITLFNEERELFMGFVNIAGQQKFAIVARTDSNKFCNIENTEGNTSYTCQSANSPISILTSVSTDYLYLMYDTNYEFRATTPVELRNYYSDSIIIDNNDIFPTLKNLSQYNSWSEYEQEYLEGYTEVNLDNYEYVLLTLKDYSQTNAFQTNLQVKGQIGITPIYNFGQTSKDAITGVQVQDRCNLNYSDYTSYPFYIIQSDLQNNAIYAVKECSSNSSFKFDNTIFNITYITQENEDSPTVTIDGKTYNVIPYEDLPSTATKNEEDNYIPGESGSATDTGGLDSAIKNIQQRMSEIWNTFTYFTDFVGQIFSSLPTEVQTILLSAFTVAIILGLIKIFIN